MVSEAPILYLPNGQVHKAREDDKSRSFGPFVLFRNPRLDGAQPKQSDWRLYLEMYKRHPWVKAAIDKLVKVATNTGYEFVPRHSRATVREDEFRVAQAFFQRQADFMGEVRRIYRDLMVFGDAFLYVVPDRRRRPARLKRLAPWTIHIKAKPDGEVEEYVQADPHNLREDAIVKFLPHEIIHFKIDNPEDDLYGLSPLEALKTTVTSDLFAMQFNQKFFENGASTGTIIIIEEATNDELERNKRWIQESYIGTENAHKPIIIAGKARIERGIASHEEMSFLAGRDRNKAEILAGIDVPPAKLGSMETANRSNSKEQDKTFRSEAVGPLHTIFETKFNDHFMRDILGLQDTIFKHSEADVRDAIELADLHARYLDRGVLSINEVRANLGKIDISGGDIPTIMTPTGAVPVDRLDLYFKLPETNVGQVPVTPDAQAPADQPPPDQEPQAEVGYPPVTRSTTREWLTQARWLLQRSRDRHAMRHVYTLLTDFEDAHPHWMLTQAREAVRRALRRSDDAELVEGYIERADRYLALLLSTIEDDHGTV